MHTFSEEAFKAPPKAARPMVRWWWTGVDVQKDELIRELAELDEAGFVGAEIQAFMIGSPPDLAKTAPARFARSHRFMQPHYYEMVKAVLDEAAQRDMFIDLTICSAWPAGGVHITKENSMRVLLMGTRVLRGGRRYTGPVPRFKKPLFYTVTRFLGPLRGLQTYHPEDMRLVRVVAARPLGRPGKVRSVRPRTAYLDLESLIDLTDKVSEGGVLEWAVPQGRWQLFAFYAGPSGAHPLFDAKQDPDKISLVLDHYASGPIRDHLDRHLGRAKVFFGEHFGNTLRAFFTDSFELSAEWAWTDAFLDEFQKRRGYDLTPYLPVNYVPTRDNKYLTILMPSEAPCFDFEGDLGERIRYDFERTISDLFTEQFAQAMTTWADANGLKSRIQAYGIRADTLKTFGIAHIPETEQLYAGGVIDFLKLAGSAGVIYDKPLVTAESLVWNQRDYLTTPLKWKVAADRLFVSGINQMIYHGFPYQNPDFAYPGYCGFSTPHLFKMMCFASNMSRANPFWEFFPQVNAYVTRCQYTLQLGRTVCNVGLFYPLLNYPDSVLKEEELVGGYLDAHDAPRARRTAGGALKKKLNRDDRWTLAQIDLGDHLMSNGYYYVHVNEESLLRASVERGKLVVGSAELEVLILSQVERITVQAAEKLEQIQSAGIPVVFVGKVPDQQPGFLDYRQNDARVSGITGRLATQHGNVLEEASQVPSHLMGRLGVKPNLTFDEPQPTLYYIHKQTEQEDIYFLRHATGGPRTLVVRFPHWDRVPYLLDPWTGEITPVVQYEDTQEGVRMELAFDAYGSCLIAFCQGEPLRHVVSGELRVEREDGSLVAYTPEAGEYSFTLDDGSKKEIKINRGPPERIALGRWHLETKLRSPDGTTKLLGLDLEELKNWRDIPQLQYCSSKGVYSTAFSLGEEYCQGNLAVWMDLGRVHDVAVVRVNGIELTPLLVYPYRADTAPHLKAGQNEIQVTITPTLRNRLMGYARTGRKEWKQFKRRKEYAPSGLMGPVHLIPMWRLEI